MAASRRLRSLRDQTKAVDEVEVSRTVAGRTFRSGKNGWEDETAKPEMRQVEVKYGSDAYFQLISAKPEWARYLSVGKQVSLRTGKGTVVVVGEKGKEMLTAQELTDLER